MGSLPGGEDDGDHLAALITMAVVAILGSFGLILWFDHMFHSNAGLYGILVLILCTVFSMILFSVIRKFTKE